MNLDLKSIASLDTLIEIGVFHLIDWAISNYVVGDMRPILDKNMLLRDTSLVLVQKVGIPSMVRKMIPL